MKECFGLLCRLKRGLYPSKSSSSMVLLCCQFKPTAWAVPQEQMCSVCLAVLWVQDSPEMSCCVQSTLSTQCELGPLSCSLCRLALSPGCPDRGPGSAWHRVRNCSQGWTQVQPRAHTCSAVWVYPADSPEPPLSLQLHLIYTTFIILCCRTVSQNDNQSIKAATSQMQFWITQRRWTHSLYESWQIGYHLLPSFCIFFF